MKKKKIAFIISSFVMLLSGCLEFPPSHNPPINRYGIDLSFNGSTYETTKLYGVALGGAGCYCDSVLLNLIPLTSYHGVNYGISCNLLCLSNAVFNGIVVSGFSNGTIVNGLGLGLVGGSGEPGYGVSAALLNAWNTRGLQLGLLNMTDHPYIFSLGLVNLHGGTELEGRTLSLGLFNYADTGAECIQIGLINYSKSAYFPLLPFFNFF